MTIQSRHYRRDLFQQFPKNNETDDEYKNNVLAKLKRNIRDMDKETTIQAIKCTIREICGGKIDHTHDDLDRLKNYKEFKENTTIITANLSTFLFDVDKTTGAIILLFSLCEHLAHLLDPPVTVKYQPTRAQKEELMRKVLLHEKVSGGLLNAVEGKDKLVDADLNVMFTRDRNGNIGDLSLGNNRYLDYCHIEFPNETQRGVRIGTVDNRVAKGYFFNPVESERDELIKELT